MIARTLLAFALLVTSLGPVLARDRQVGNIVFTPPPDWKVGSVRDEGWVILRNDRKDERCRFCKIIIHIGTEASGSFDRWVSDRMKLALDDGEVKQNMPTKVLQDRRLGEVHTYTRTIKDRGTEMQIFMAFKMKDRWEMIHFSGDADDADELKESAAAMSEEFLPMLSKIGFVSKGHKAVIGKSVPGKLDGVWFGSRVDYGLNFDATMRVDVRPVIFTFWRDGRFFKGIPDSGISAFNYDSTVLTNTTETGNYILKNDEVLLFYADGDRDTLPRDGDTFEDGNATLTKVRLPNEGIRFEGNLHNFNYSPFAAGISGGIASVSDWFFVTDGTYTSDRFVGASGSFADGGGGFTTSNDTAKLRGTYRIADGLIRLTPPKGNEIVWPFFLYEKDGKWEPVVRGEYLRDAKIDQSQLDVATPKDETGWFDFSD